VVALLLAVGIAALSSSTLVQIARVGVYHDELWNYPAAVALARGMSIEPRLEVQILGRSLPLVPIGPHRPRILPPFDLTGQRVTSTRAARNEADQPPTTQAD